jgi:leader peptidase (prepilin peptidase)/N-methyltransferase
MRAVVIPSLPAVFYILLFFLGASVGSFSAVLITRFDAGKSIFSPSSCGECGKRLKPKDMVPILSYLYYKGKCAYCNEHISLKLPVIEIFLGLYSVLVYLKAGFGFEYVKLMIFSAFLFPVSYIDYLYYKIRLDYLALCAVLITGLYAVFDISSIFVNLYGGLLGFAFFYVIRFFYKKKLGYGDVFLLSLLGLFTGINGVFWVVLMGSLLGILYALFCHVFKIKGIRQRIPFAPFLSVAAFIFMLLSEHIKKLLPTNFI